MGIFIRYKSWMERLGWNEVEKEVRSYSIILLNCFVEEVYSWFQKRKV